MRTIEHLNPMQTPRNLCSHPRHPSPHHPPLAIQPYDSLYLLILIPICRIDSTSHAPSRIQLQWLLPFKLLADCNRLVTSKSFPHIDHAALAFAVSPFKLLAACGERIEEWGPEAISGLIALNEDAFRGLEALGEGGA